MFARILLAIDDVSDCQAALDLVMNVAAEGSQVRALHLRIRELSGFKWYSPETGDQASLVAEAATFELRMAGLAAGGTVRYVPVDRVAQAILAEAKAFDAQLIAELSEAFVDVGRVWSDYAIISPADGNSIGLKYGIGAGVFLQWGEAAIFRVEVAYSPDAESENPGFPVGIYVSDGAMF